MRKTAKKTRIKHLLKGRLAAALMLGVLVIGVIVVSMVANNQIDTQDSEVRAYSVTPLFTENLVTNPWFRSSANPAQPGLDGWTDVAGTNKYWSVSQKDSNPSPDNVQGTSARWAFGSGQGGGSGVGGADAYLYQIVSANKDAQTLWFKTHWVTGFIDIAEATIYGSNQAVGPWTKVWTPLSVTQTSSSNMAWTETALLSQTVDTGYPYYKVEFHGRYPENRNQGFKFTGVYFTANQGEKPDLSGEPGTPPVPTPTGTPIFPNPTITPRPTPTSIPGGEVGENQVPTILTTTLRDGRVGGRYTASIEGLDANGSDVLKFSISGLPQGISITRCELTQRNTAALRCRIEGTPVKAGTYQLQVTLSDSAGAQTNRLLSITIR